jgi:hypothetical protein
MLYKSLGFFALAALCSTGYARAGCTGSDPSVTTVAVTSMTSDAVLAHYQITGTVVNLGTENQPSNTLQSVDIFSGTQKLDAKSIPPLKAGQSFTFTYTSDRSIDAGKGSSKLTFTMDVQNITSREQNCDLTNDSFTLAF